jgi:hypothetical protein
MSEPIKTALVIHISTNVSRGCPVCRKFSVGGSDDWEASVNHMLGHGWQLIHVGTETGFGSDHDPAHHTVAVLVEPAGKSDRQGFFG